MLIPLVNANIISSNKVYVNDGAAILCHSILPLDNKGSELIKGSNGSIFELRDPKETSLNELFYPTYCM